jgi:hypothetical protein
MKEGGSSTGFSSGFACWDTWLAALLEAALLEAP